MKQKIHKQQIWRLCNKSKLKMVCFTLCPLLAKFSLHLKYVQDLISETMQGFISFFIRAFTISLMDSSLPKSVVQAMTVSDNITTRGTSIPQGNVQTKKNHIWQVPVKGKGRWCPNSYSLNDRMTRFRCCSDSSLHLPSSFLRLWIKIERQERCA